MHSDYHSIVIIIELDRHMMTMLSATCKGDWGTRLQEICKGTSRVTLSKF